LLGFSPRSAHFLGRVYTSATDARPHEPCIGARLIDQKSRPITQHLLTLAPIEGVVFYGPKLAAVSQVQSLSRPALFLSKYRERLRKMQDFRSIARDRLKKWSPTRPR